jgi:alkylated DNA repair dioxygenase AlkB
MRLTSEEDKRSVVGVLLKRRSLYFMSGQARYEYAHEILPSGAVWGPANTAVHRERRLSLIFRDQLGGGEDGPSSGASPSEAGN